MIDRASAWLLAHPATHAVLGMLAIVSFFAWVNWVTWRRTPADWARYQLEKPRRALALRISRALFPHLRKFFPQLAPFLPPTDPPELGS
jgi:hypothetical protein